MAFNVMTNIYLTIPILTLLLLSLDNWPEKTLGGIAWFSLVQQRGVA